MHHVHVKMKKELHILNCDVKDVMYNNIMGCSLTTSVDFKSPTRRDGEYTIHFLMVNSEHIWCAKP